MLGLECLAVAIFFEARAEPSEGQFAVADVILNRVESDRWPDTICDVVFQPKQFSFTHDGKSDRMEKYAEKNVFEWRAMKEARRVAEIAFNSGYTDITSTHYHALSVRPSWAKHYRKDKRIGNHIFYTAPRGK